MLHNKPFSLFHHDFDPSPLALVDFSAVYGTVTFNDAVFYDGIVTNIDIVEDDGIG